MRRSNIISALVLSATGVIVAACGDDDPTGPGDDQAQVSATITDNPNSAQPSVTPSDDVRFSLGAAPFTGTLDADVTVELVSETGAVVSLGNPAAVGALALQTDGQTATLFTSVQVPADTYTAVRFTLSSAQVNLNAGSTIGPVTLASDATLSIDDDDGDGQVTIEMTLSTPTQLTADSQTTFALDLNAEAWVTENAVNASAVAESQVESATTLSVQ